MPIRRELRKFYGAAWRETRARILQRAGNKCEQCGVPDRAFVGRVNGAWFDERRGWIDHYGHPITGAHRPRDRAVWIILTVAHLNHTPGDDRDENLAALCQWCHLNYDKLHHKETRSARKDARRPLLSQGAEI